MKPQYNDSSKFEERGMTHALSGRPDPTEYPASYDPYISRVEGQDILAILQEQIKPTLTLIRDIPETQGHYRYAAGKWTVKQVIGHLIDSERVFAYRALRFARNDKTILPGFDQEEFASHANYDAIPLVEIAAELECVRHATCFLFRHLDASAWSLSGVANNNEITVRALAYVIAGHERHHLSIIKSRYLH
jgi:hypothetical protein